MTNYSNNTNGSAATQSNGNHTTDVDAVNSANGNGVYTNGHSKTNGHGDTNGYSNGTNGHSNGVNGHSNGTNGHSDAKTNGDDNHNNIYTRRPSQTVAICGMACRLPGGIASPSELWSFLHGGRDARGPVPPTRYNVSAHHSPNKKPGSVIAQQGYFLDSTNDLAALDTSFFSMSNSEVEMLDPQQRLLLEVVREALDDSGETGWKGSNVGVYVGSHGNDFHNLMLRDTQAHGPHQILGSHDFMLSNRISHELDLNGPSVTVRTESSASLVSLNEACMAIARGDCTSAIVGGSSIIMTPTLAAAESEQGLLSPEGSCNTFSANADGYARGEGIVAIYLKPLADAIRDGNPIRAVVTGSATSHSGHTSSVSLPSSQAQEAIIRQAYRSAGITDIAKTGYFECHGTASRDGDSIETAAVSACFGKAGVHIGSVKANLGHTGGASGLVSVIKAVLALENRTIPPSIKSLPRNPEIPFEDANLIVPTEPTPWPEDRDERVSVNCFGIGGSNAHAIIESAASFNVLRKSKTGRAANTPHLLLLSANTPASLKAMGEKYKTFLGKNSSLLPDVAYTLANKREHLPHRTFAVCTGDNFTLGAPAASKIQQGQETSLVMVFTGQGAQSARMGFELLRSKANPVFSNTIASLDKALKELGPLAPSWTLDEELRKPARKSRVDEAEFSWPLCIALQIALIDGYASIGIRPAAVLGHSSGEIAAAYAAGGLSASEAIKVAFLCGLATKQQSRKGAMAALSLSWKAAQEHLISGAVLACDNAPNNVTISGDAGSVDEMVKKIKETSPGVSATALKVEKAYHSPHMAEIKAEYSASMINAGIEGKAHTVPFFSTVSGELLAPGSKSSKFGPKYWQANLESPVLFNSAVTAAIQHHAGPSKQIFLEIGPHAALAGPIRQILTQNSSSASYISTLVRKTDSVESWLSAIGSLFSQHVSLDFQTLMPAGNALSDLPTYAWDHHRTYWKESRIAHEWRMRKHSHHDLLGSKVPDSTDLEPVWRNMLHIENAPWIQDHKISADTIFPFAGYVAMAAEAIRQISDIDEAVEFRNVAVRAALVVSKGSPTELVTTFHRLRLTDSLDSDWWEFNIASHNGHTWTKHCSGEVQARDEKDATPNRISEHGDLPRKTSSKRWYDTMRRGGLDYGHHFASLENITTTTTGTRCARAQIRNNWHGDEQFYHLHPVILDSYFQLLSIAAQYGLTRDYHRVVPTSVGSLIIRRSTIDNLVVSATAEPVSSSVRGTGAVTAGDEPIIELSGVRLVAFPNNDVEERLPIAARSEWVPHIETEALNKVVKPTRDNQAYAAALDELVSLAIAASRRSTAGLDAIESLQQYKKWLDETPSSSDELDAATLNARIGSLVTSLASTPAAPIAKAIALVTDNAPAMLSGRKKASEVLDTEDTLGKFNRFLEEFDASAFINRLGHYKPNLRVLELNADIGLATTGFVKDLTRPDGQVLFSQYVVSDPSLGRVAALKRRFQGLPNMNFTAFDIGVDADLQGFSEKNFDLIIATGVLHSTPKLSESLVRVRQLLAPSGRLLLQSLRPNLSWSKYVLGLFPSWHIGIDDGRAGDPYVDVQGWQKRLVAADLESAGEPAFDSDESSHLSHVIVARPQRDHLPAKKASILSERSTESSKSHPITQELLARGYEISYCSLADTPPPSQDIIALLDEQTPFLKQLDATKLEQLRTFIDRIADSGLLWITQPSQSQCADPSFAQIHGLARSIRSELGIAFATCEVDDRESPQGCQAVVDVFQNFAERVNDGEIEPDFEYIIDNGVRRVNRFFPVPASKADLAETTKDARLTIGHLGRFDTLHWEREAVDELQGDEVQVETHAGGLNLRDVMVATGNIELSSPTFGYEATGIVRHVGPKAGKLSVGDRVALIGFNTFASTVTTTEKLCEKLPDELDFTSGASMPLAFATAIYSLINVGGLEKDQSVLIHGGCGGVGLAAIQVARMIGAEIYTTVSSEKRIDFLVQEFGIPRDHIFNSRNVSFEQDLLRATNGNGVDLVLNSLSGELLHATWRCVAKWGTLVEIGQRDLVGAGKLNMELFLANRSYRCVDIDAMCKEKPDMVGRLLHSMMGLYRDGHIRDIPIDKVFPGSKTQEALQHMQQGSHIGKIILEFRDSTSGELQLGQIQPTTASTTTVLDGSASYLLVGGLGGLGRSVAVWMVQHGAQSLTFLSRSAGTADKDKLFVEELQSMGCEVHLVRGSVAEVADVARAVAKSPRPLKGVIQMSTVLHNQAWRTMTIDEWNDAAAPKVQGTWNLHNETQSLNLDFFILFSSLSSIVGQSGQAGYASANAFLDAFATFRTSKGLPCASLNIGAVEGAVYRVQDDEPWRAVQESELLDVLGTAMRQSLPTSPSAPEPSLFNPGQTLVGIAPAIPLSSPDSSARLRKDVRMSVFRSMRSQARGGASSNGLRQFLSAAKESPELLSKPESVALLTQEIGKKLLGLVLRPADDEIDASLSLAQLGLDSMVAIEVRAWWKQMFGLNISVMEMLSMGTLGALGMQASKGLLALHG